MEETAVLAYRLDAIEAERRQLLISRFTGDPQDWLGRLQSVPEQARDAFLHVLHVAASLSGTVNPLEEQLVRRAAEALGGRTYDPAPHGESPASKQAAIIIRWRRRLSARTIIR